MGSLGYLLNDRERRELESYRVEYFKRFGTIPEADPNAVFFLGDNTSFSLTWSTVSGKIPTYRRNSGMFWIPSLQRWMVPADKLASLGFPTTLQTSEMLGVDQPLPTLDPVRGASITGNSFHFTNCGIVMLLAMTCFGPSDASPRINWDQGKAH